VDNVFGKFGASAQNAVLIKYQNERRILLSTPREENDPFKLRRSLHSGLQPQKAKYFH
jgi:hypothetical protein